MSDLSGLKWTPLRPVGHAACCVTFGPAAWKHVFSAVGGTATVECTGWRCRACKLFRTPRLLRPRTALGYGLLGHVEDVLAYPAQQYSARVPAGGAP